MAGLEDLLLLFSLRVGSGFRNGLGQSDCRWPILIRQSKTAERDIPKFENFKRFLLLVVRLGGFFWVG